MGERVEKGIIVSRRKVIPVGSSKAVTLSKRWLDIQKWLGREVTELVSVANDAIVLVPPEKEEKAKRILKMLEEEGGEKT
jgi:hypothetical protein